MYAVLLFISSLFVKDEPKYPVLQIPEELKKDVNVVVRENEIRFTVVSTEKATLQVTQAYTILNAAGKDFADKIVAYDKQVKISSFKAAAYDQFGNQIKKLKSNEIIDQSAYDGFSLFTDNRLKYADLTQTTYPYTVEFEYELDYKNLFATPDFRVLPGEKASVQHALFQLAYPKDLALRYELVNLTDEPVKGKTETGETLTWTFQNVKPVKLEPLGPSAGEIFPTIVTAPTKFAYDGYAGVMSSWDEYGNWIKALNKDRNALPEATRQKIKELTQGVPSQEEKVKRIYEYMQSKTRYVSIQLGIGGYQPFSATSVDQNGYGDCKALSNYMVAMLNEAGIKSNYTLIFAGENHSPLRSRFPSSQFNHVVVSVPSGRDTLWLECTSQTNPLGYAGRFTGNRKALAITDTGAKVVTTPSYNADLNIQRTSAEVMLQANGNATAKVKTTYSGLQYENGNLDAVINKSPDDQKKWIQNNTRIPSFDLLSFSMTNVKQRIPSAVVSSDLQLNRFASVSGKRIFVSPNLTNRSTFIPEKVDNRKSPVVTRFPYTDFDTIRYVLPEGIFPEFLPEPMKFNSRFGEYEASFKVDEHGLIYMRRMKMHGGVFPAESYNELIEFYRNVNKADNTKVVFLSKT